MKRLLVSIVAVALALGCMTQTTTYPDGRIVEEERLDPDFVAAFVGLGQSALQLAAAHGAEPVKPDAPPLIADMARLELISSELQTIMADGVTGDEWDRLQVLYDEVNAILRRQGVKVNLKVKT